MARPVDDSAKAGTPVTRPAAPVYAPPAHAPPAYAAPSTTGPSTLGPSATGPSTFGPFTTGPSATGPSTPAPPTSPLSATRTLLPLRLRASDDPAPVLALIRSAFADMDGRINPPSSMTALTLADVAAQMASAEVWVIPDADHHDTAGRAAHDTPPNRAGSDGRGGVCALAACVILTPRPGRLYLGRLAVAATCRRRGLARQLCDVAAERARALFLPVVELQVRIELVENHAAFAAMGFRQTGMTSHPGFDRPTALTFTRNVQACPL